MAPRGWGPIPDLLTDLLRWGGGSAPAETSDSARSEAATRGARVRSEIGHYFWRTALRLHAGEARRADLPALARPAVENASAAVGRRAAVRIDAVARRRRTAAVVRKAAAAARP